MSREGEGESGAVVEVARVNWGYFKESLKQRGHSEVTVPALDSIVVRIAHSC